ncbi:MAG: endolytic transglycosylase MltG [Myxococcota bacterium]
MKWLRRALLGLSLAVAAAGMGGFWILWQPASPIAERRLFVVEEGEPLTSIAERLQRAGLLPRQRAFGPWIWVLWARLSGVDRRVRAGEYELSTRLRPLQVLAHLVDGRAKTWPVTLPEGLRLDEVASRLGEAGIVDPQEFLRLARDPEVAAALGVPATTLEGYLYPETYRFRHRTAPREVLAAMVAEFRSAWTDRDRALLSASGRSLHDVVTLASIVEKETGQASERPLIAAVFRNRLQRGMRLQTDPTVIYGLWLEHGRFDGNLRRRDLTEETAYNTYLHAGLPPGAIASPGIDSIRAVLSPADVPYLYFVSRNDGSHVFSRTLREHNAAVERFQKRRAQARRQPARGAGEASP